MNFTPEESSVAGGRNFEAADADDRKLKANDRIAEQKTAEYEKQHKLTDTEAATTSGSHDFVSPRLDELRDGSADRIAEANEGLAWEKPDLKLGGIALGSPEDPVQGDQ